MDRLRVEIDSNSGFCFGVVRAINQAQSALEDGGKVYSLGDIVHNRGEVQRLETMGMSTISQRELSSLNPGERVLIRAHGEPPLTYSLAQSGGLELLDATCPVVARLQRVVKRAHALMGEVAGSVVLLGKRGHAEVVGLTGQVDDDVIVIEGVDDVEAVDFSHPIYFLSQTTQSIALFEQIAQILRERIYSAEELTIDDTICRQLSSREDDLRKFAMCHDVIIFVSGRKSSNGKVLFGVCKGANERSYNVEEASEVDPAWFHGGESVGVCGATSTPLWLMESVANRVEGIE
ncbi:MAG: 4-hydroxy-3-methylbut-2-enyl diphosphate reductase [Rikenellaceae bacterium]